MQVSPADGRVVACGKVCKDRVENVKGIRYSMAKFLGPQTWALSGDEPKAAVQEVGGQGMRDYGNKLLQREQEDELFECVIYLAPGDYHRFHSPAQWTIHHRRHFPGDLLSVHPKVASWFPNLFVVNERAAYYGKWQHGFFALGVVGATNVSSIKIPFDLVSPALYVLALYMPYYCIGDEPAKIQAQLVARLAVRVAGGAEQRLLLRRVQHGLDTGAHFRSPAGLKFKRNSWLDLRFESPVEQSKGSYFGEFNMGSTLVLIFEAPRGSRFTVCMGDRVRVGQRLFQVPGET
ncbi:unnamed protein product [Notodromas monacha]|uniref:phosphatidylserine decarboxylase n=1 Tax=Notodromas monacha TaxID=399045 RepID=A0A7R9BHN0_9CRUS|nr:unnamed protein product [Notodromas monacha]CAG0914626.1 unnamed protein product [Notodromas monacha]